MVGFGAEVLELQPSEHNSLERDLLASLVYLRFLKLRVMFKNLVINALSGVFVLKSDNCSLGCS